MSKNAKIVRINDGFFYAVVFAYTIVMFLFGLLLFELVLLLTMELYSRISDWWWKFRFNGRID